MGKPSTTQLSRRSSNQSLTSAPSKSKMKPIITAQKNSRAMLKRIQKTDVTIKKLFTKLRRNSRSLLNSSKLSQSCETSVIEIDDSFNNTVLIVNDPTGHIPSTSRTDIIKSGSRTQTAKKRNKNHRRSKARPIVIDDEPDISTLQPRIPLHHSTPIKQKPSIDEMIVDVTNKLDNSNNNKTRNINSSSFLTIDLTTETTSNKSAQPTVIDLDSTSNQDCVLTSVSQSSSMSGDSDVTVLRRPARTPSITQQIKTGLVNLNTSEKDKILAFISENLFNGCSIPSKIQTTPRAPETAEDTYIKEVILGKKLSRNSIGSNVYNPEKYVNTTGLRMIVIDGSNVAMAHGLHRYFSVVGLKIVIDYFLSRGHVVKAFVPRFRNKSGKSSQPQTLIQLERQGHVIFTPSREIFGRDVSSYDDRYIIQCAAEFEGVIVSNDCFKDLIRENPRWADVINNRTLQFNWVQGMIMFPRDPLGKNGPTLEQFLKMPRQNLKR